MSLTFYSLLFDVFPQEKKNPFVQSLLTNSVTWQLQTLGEDALLKELRDWGVELSGSQHPRGTDADKSQSRAVRTRRAHWGTAYGAHSGNPSTWEAEKDPSLRVTQ